MRVARAQEVNYEKAFMDWPAEYYRSMEPMERKKLLMAAIERGLMPEEDAIRLELWKRRYPKAEQQVQKGDPILDTYLAAWMHLYYVNERLGSWFGRKKLLKDTKKHLEDMGLLYYEEAGALETQMIRNELYHLACYYIKICKEDSKYSSLVMGLGKLKEDSFANKIAETFYHVCYQAPKGLGLDKEFHLLMEAAHDAYEDIFPNHLRLLDERIEGGDDTYRKNLFRR